MTPDSPRERPAPPDRDRSQSERDRPAGTVARARVFWSGRSQAVRLPKAFRVSGSEVLIRSDGNRIILEPVESLDENGWPRDFWEIFGELDSSFSVGDRDRPAESREPLEAES